MRYEFKALGFSSMLIALNIIVMGLISLTPLAQLTSYLFQYMIVGVLVFGAAITAGVVIAKKGISDRNIGLAGAGTALLQLAYGVFGGGILTFVSAEMRPLALLITFIGTLGIAVFAGLLVYLSGRSFHNWGKYANYIFLAVLGIALFGTFLPAFGILAFTLVFIGFFVYLVYEIWNMREQNAGAYLNGIGIYVAFMGVFVEILQIVVRMLMEE